MMIVFILLLTVLSIALRLASMSAMSYKKVADRKAAIENKDAEEGREVDPNSNWNIKSEAAGATAKSLRLAYTVVSSLRNILSVIAPILAIITIFAFIFMAVASSGFMTLFTETDEHGNLAMVQNLPGSSSGNTSNGSNNGTNNGIYQTTGYKPGQAFKSTGKKRVLLVGDSRTVQLGIYTFGMELGADSTLIGETPSGDYVFAKGSMGLSWMKEHESEIDAQVNGDTAVVINMGTNDAYSYDASAKNYIEWLNKKAEDWTSKGATVWFMNTGPVSDSGTSALKTSHVVSFNNAVKSGLSSKVGYIDEYATLNGYGNVVYDEMGVHYDKATYHVVWNLVRNTVKNRTTAGVHTLAYVSNSPTYTEKNRTLEYHLYIPNNAKTNMALIVFLHGSGEEGKLDKLKDYGLMHQAKKLYGDDFPFIALQPCSPYYGWSDKPLKELIDCIVEEYSIDENHIILTGHSMGAVGVWDYAGKYGDFFSCAVPVSWWTGSLSGDRLTNLASIPIRAYYGTKETSGYYEGMDVNLQKNIETIKSAGGLAELIVLEDYEHYMTKDQTYTKELFEWMLSR